MGAFDFKGITDVDYSAQAQTEPPVDTVEQQTQVQQVAQTQRPTLAKEDLDAMADEDLFARYGVNGRISYSDLNKAMRDDNLHTEKQYAVQQAWFNARQKDLDSLDPITREELQAKFDALKAKPTTLKEHSHTGVMAESVSKGIDGMQGGASMIAAQALSHLDKSDAEIDAEIAKEQPEKFSKYQSSQAKYDKIKQELAIQTMDDPTLLYSSDDNTLDKMVRKRMSKEELADLDWYNESHNSKRSGAMFSDDANGMTKYFSKTGIKNMIAANAKSQYAGAEERKQAILQAGEEADGVFSSAWETAKAAVFDPGTAISVGLESTGTNLVPQLAGIAAGVATRSPMVYQFVSSLGGFPAEVQGAVAEKMSEFAIKKYNRDLSELNDDELLNLIKENKAEFSKAMDKGAISAAATMFTETPVAKGVGLVGAGFRKLATNPATKSAVMRGFGITGEAVTKFTGEGWEEAFGQIAANIATGEQWDKGVGQSFVLALASLENVPNTVAIGKDIKNILAEDAKSQPTPQGEQPQTETQSEQTPTQDQGPTEIKSEGIDPRYKRAGDVLGFLERNRNGDYVNESGNPVSLLDRQGAIQQQMDNYVGEMKTLGTELGFDMETEEGRRAFADEVRKQNAVSPVISIDEGVDSNALFQEFTRLEQQKQDPQSDKEAIEARQREIQSMFDQENVTSDGEIITTNSFDTEYQNWTLTQGTNNESGSNNRNGSQNADGQTIQQGTDVANNIGTQSSGETSEPVQTAQTETATTGNSQSYEGATADLTQQPNNNPTTSSTVGLDGRTDQANGQRVEQGELGEQGGEQDREPTQTAQSGSTDSGVQQRTQSGSVGETLDLGTNTPNVAMLSDNRLRDNIRTLAAKVRNPKSYANSGGYRSEELAQDRTRLKALLDESANRMGVESKADDILKRIAKVTKYEDTKGVFGTGVRAEQAQALFAKIDDITATVQRGYSKTADALAAVREKLRGLLDDIYTYIATFPGRVRKTVSDARNSFAEKRKARAEAKDKAKRTEQLANDLLDSIVAGAEDLQPKAGDSIVKYSKWKKTMESNLAKVRSLIQQSLNLDEDNNAKPSEKGESIDDLLRPFQRDTRKDNTGVLVTDDKETSKTTNEPTNVTPPVEPTTDSQPSKPESVGGNTASEPSDVPPQEPVTNAQGATTSSTSDTPVQTGQTEPVSTNTDTVESGLRTTFKSEEDFKTYVREQLRSTDDNTQFWNDIRGLVNDRKISFRKQRIAEKRAEKLHTWLMREALPHKENATNEGRKKQANEETAKTVEDRVQQRAEVPYLMRKKEFEAFMGSGDSRVLSVAIRRENNAEQITEYAKRFYDSLSGDDKVKFATGFIEAVDNTGYSQKTKREIGSLFDKVSVEVLSPHLMRSLGKELSFKIEFGDEELSYVRWRDGIDRLIAKYNDRLTAKDLDLIEAYTKEFVERVVNAESRYDVDSDAKDLMSSLARERKRLEQKDDIITKYEFGLKRKNKNSVTFSQHKDGSVTASISNDGIYTKTLVDMQTAKDWVNQTLIGSDNKHWNGKTRKLVSGEGVFGESSTQATAAKITKEPKNSNRIPAIEKENRINRTIDQAVQSSVEPSEKDTMVDRIRNAGKVTIHGIEVSGNMAKLAVAHDLLNDDKSNFKEVFEAFKQAGGSPQSATTLRNGGWKVTENKTQHNSVVAKAVAEKIARVGDTVKFDGTVERADPKAEYKRLEESTSVEDAVTVALAQQPQGSVEITSSMVRQVLKSLDVTTEEKTAMFEAVENYVGENQIEGELDGSTTKGMNEAIAWASTDKGFMDWVKDEFPALQRIFIHLKRAITSVIAIVAVGSMTIPNDAMAQQGFSTYTQGQQISGVSKDASNTINWVVDNKDHKGKSFVVADKAKGVIHVVSPDGKVLNTQNALFGKAKGNSATTGNTPSGRFALKKTDTKTLTKADQKAFGDSVLDLADPQTGRAVTSENGLIFAMHRVMNTPQRHKALSTATENDNYITNGCINVPTAFYDTAVDNLDGAMVYILDMPQTAKKASTRSQPTKVSNSSPTSDWSKPTMAKWSVKPATNVNELNPSLNNDKLQATLKKALGDFADNVTLISSDEFANHAGFEKLKSNGIEGFYDPNTKQVAIVVDNIEAQDGLSANDRLAWVAWHELYHKGLDVKYGNDLGRVVSDMGTNSFIDNLAEAIMADRATNSLASIDKDTAIQEALVELGAALQTKNLGGLKDRYGVSVPMALRDDILGTLGKFYDRIKTIVGKVIGKPTVTNKQVEALLEDSIAYAKVGKADKAMMKSILDDFQEPTSAVSQSALFSANGISGKAQALWEKVFPRDLYYLFTGNDVGRVGTTPDRDSTKSMKAKRTKMNIRSRFHTLMNDSQQIIIDLDPQGDGGELSRSVANFSNKKNQLTRKWERKLKGLEMQFIEFAQKNKDVFKSMFDRKQVDDTVQSVTTALHAITGGNENVRKNIEEIIFGKDVTLADGSTLHVDGLLDKVNQHQQYIANAQFNGVQVPSYTVKQFEHYQTQLNEMIAIQNKFDQDNYNILSNTNSQNKNRENWRGYDGLTFAEAEQKLKDFHKQGLLDNDVTDGLTKREYEVKKYIEVNGVPQVVKVKHYSYEVADVEKKAKGRIMPLVDAYVDLSHEMHQFTVDQIGEKRAGGKTSGKWEVSTMGKVDQIYSEQAKDSSGNPIDRLYDATIPTNIDNIISMKHAAQYTGRRMGRATQGGTAMEQLAWRLSLTAQQSASKDIAVAMNKLHESRPDLVKRYSQNDNEYAMVNGIVHEIPVLDKNGNPVLDNNGEPKTKLVKLSFADQEANAALFGDNLPSQDDSDAWFFFRAVAHIVKSWVKLNSMSLTQTAGFAVNNAYKGFNEKLNQMMAWDKDHAFVKSIKDPNKRALFEGTGTKLHAMAQLNKIDVRGLPRLAAREKAALMFAQDLANNKLADFMKFAINKLPSLGAEKMVQEEYAKLVEMYERGGISSRVEELLADTSNKKLRYGFGKTPAKVVDGFFAMLETATTMTMAQELVSSLVMVDFLTNQVGMDRDVAIDANLHFMNFNKRGTSQMMNYLRKYTMFANAIAQGSRAFERSFFIQTNNENDSVFGIKGVKWSKPALWRTARNVGMSIAMHSFARLVAANICPDKDGLGNQVGNLNEYQLLREIPISTGCNEYFRYPVEYGVGMVENAAGVSLVQIALGNWSVEQAGSFIIDAFKDNASPIGLAMGDSDNAFGKVAFLLYPFIPDPLKEPALAFGGVDQFGNKLNANFVNEAYRPGSGKKTTDSAWHKMAEDLYGSGMLGNLTPEEMRVLVTGGFRGAARDILTWAIENDPKKSVWKSLLGVGSVYREPKEMDTVVYTMVQNRLDKRYNDLVLIYNQAKGRDKVLPSKSWVEKNGYELSADEQRSLDLISQYFERMKNKRLDQETRLKYNIELLKGLKKIEGSE